MNLLSEMSCIFCCLYMHGCMLNNHPDLIRIPSLDLPPSHSSWFDSHVQSVCVCVYVTSFTVHDFYSPAKKI